MDSPQLCRGSAVVEWARTHLRRRDVLAGFNRRDGTIGSARRSRQSSRSVASVLSSERSAGETSARSASVVPVSNPIRNCACTKDCEHFWRFAPRVLITA